MTPFAASERGISGPRVGSVPGGRNGDIAGQLDVTDDLCREDMSGIEALEEISGFLARQETLGKDISNRADSKSGRVITVLVAEFLESANAARGRTRKEDIAQAL